MQARSVPETMTCPPLALGCQLRVLGVARGRSLPLTRFDDQITGVSHFTNDLGLDSLDEVEVVMAIEEVRDQALPSEKTARAGTKVLTTHQ